MKQSLKEYLQNSIDSEERVYNFLLSLCTNDESIEIERKSLQFIPNELTAGKYIPDLYLPQGCKALGLPHKTIIEIKYKLQPDTLYRLKQIFDMYHTNFINGGFTFVVIFIDSANFPISMIDGLYKRDSKEKLEDSFRVYSLDNLIQKIGNRNNLNELVNKIEERKFSITDKAYQTFSKGPNTLFIGAGVSMSAKLPSWKELLEKLLDVAKQKGKNFDSSHYEKLFKESGYSSIILGRLIQNLFEDKTEMDKAIHEILYLNKSNITSPTIKTICDIVRKKKNLVRGIITNNYDDLIEQRLSKINVKNYSVCENNEPDVSFPVCHVHGLLSQYNPISSTIVLSEKEYHEIYSRAFHWSNVEQLHALQRTNCFFIGLSMTDPNLRRMLDIAKGEGDKRKSGIRHFAFIDKDVIGNSFNNIKERDEYCTQQENMLKDLGVGVIWYHDYKTLPQELLKLI